MAKKGEKLSEEHKKKMISEAKKKYRQSTKGKTTEKKYRSTEKSRKYQREWKRKYRQRPEIREKINSEQKERRLKNPEHNRKLQRDYRLRNIEQHRNRARVYHNTIAKQRFEDIKIQVMTHYSRGRPECACCGENFHIDFLALDHIKPRKEMGHKSSFTGIKIYRWIIKNDYPDGFQILCHNCNTAKFRLGICPHQKK